MAALQETLDRMGATGRARDRDRAGQQDGRGRLERMSRDELYERAQAQSVPGRSRMSKEELIEALGGQ